MTIKFHKADYVLIATGLGTCIMTFIPTNLFIDVMLYLFTAATIGGIADWFGINAMFRKPFNIGWRTNLICRNQQAIAETLSNIVENFVLSNNNLKFVFTSYSMQPLLKKWWLQDGGEGITLKAASVAVYELLEKTINESNIAKFIDNIIHKHPTVCKAIYQIINKSTEQLKSSELRQLIINELTLVVKETVNSQYFLSHLEQLISDVKQFYNENNLQRNICSWIVSDILNISNRNLGQIAQKSLIDMLDNNQLLENTLGKALNELPQQHLMIDKLLDQNILSQKIFDYFNNRFFKNKPKGIIAIKLLLQKLCAIFPGWVVEKVITAMEEKLKLLILSNMTIRNRHSIRLLIYKQICRLDSRKLVGLLEEKCLNDLQYIRINGAIMGAVAGLILYCTIAVIDWILI